MSDDETNKFEPSANKFNEPNHFSIDLMWPLTTVCIKTKSLRNFISIFIKINPTQSFNFTVQWVIRIDSNWNFFSSLLFGSRTRFFSWFFLSLRCILFFSLCSNQFILLVIFLLPNYLLFSLTRSSLYRNNYDIILTELQSAA